MWSLLRKYHKCKIIIRKKNNFRENGLENLGWPWASKFCPDYMLYSYIVDTVHYMRCSASNPEEDTITIIGNFKLIF